MASCNSSYVTCVIERVDKQTDVSISKKKKSKLMRELNHLKIFLLCVESWSSVDEEVGESLADLMAAIEGEFVHLEDAEHGGEEKMIEQVKPKMEEGYGYLSEYCFRKARVSVTDIEFWDEVISGVYSGLTTQLFDMKMSDPLKRQVEAFTVNFRSLSLLMTCLKVYLSNVKTFMPFWVYLGGAVTCAAQVSYLCWTDGMNANKAKDLIILLSDLGHKIMPCTSETIEVYIGLLKALGSCDSNYINSRVTSIMDYYFSLKDQSSLGLGFFLRFLVTTPDEFSEDVKLISLDMKTVIAKAASFDSTLTRRKSERELEPFQLVGKIVILNAEAVLMGLINRNTEDKAPSAASPLESLLEGVKMLHTFIKHPPKGIIKQEKLILTHIEEVAIGSTSLYETFSEDIIKDVPMLLVSIKLLKAQIFWMELINKSKSLKHKVETLIDVLEGLRKIDSGKPNGNSDNGKLNLVCVDEVACQAMSVYHSINANANRGADNLIKETENQLPDLLHKIAVSNLRQKMFMSGLVTLYNLISPRRTDWDFLSSF